MLGRFGGGGGGVVGIGVGVGVGVRFYGICKLMNMNLRSSDHDLKIKFGTFCRRRPNISPVTGVRKNLFGTLSTEKSLEFGQKPNRGRLSGSPHPFITIDHMMKWNAV